MMPTLDGVLRTRASTDGARVALAFGDREITYAEVAARADDWARVLHGAGVHARSRVALMAGNRPEFVYAVYGALQLGAAVVMCSPAWKARELEHALALTEPGFAVTDDAGAAAFAEVRPGVRVVRIDAPLPSGGDPPPAPAHSPDADAVLVFSSGTTGFPKAVRHTHTTMGHGVAHWITALGLTADDRFQVATPPVHILGLLNIVTAVAAGARLRLHPRFELDALLQAIEDDRITLEMAVAPIALGMANHPDLERYDLSSLRYVMWGATPVTPEVAEVVSRRAGVRWLPCYGTSEVPVITGNPVGRPDEWRLDSPGLPIPASPGSPAVRGSAGTEVRIADPVTGEILGPDRTGEIEVRSPSAMVGYLPDDATADAFHDGWYRTGDLGHLEASGWLHITDRLKEMIKVRGYQVAPAEVEAVLHADERVRDCAVFGVPDPERGEAVVAAVARVDGASLTDDDVRQLVASQLAHYKQVRHVVFVDEIPRLPSGKALRRVLRDEWVATPD
jgi:acyl-CoA synthetase (AMP-forming)/AMP-acid ligase II